MHISSQKKWSFFLREFQIGPLKWRFDIKMTILAEESMVFSARIAAMAFICAVSMSKFISA
jgi:hypothetical protein